LPSTSVPKGAGLVGVAEEVAMRGSVIWKSVRSSPRTTTCANEKTF